MKARIADSVLLLVSLAIVVLIVEGGYRLYLKFDLERARAALHTAEPNPSFGFYGWPPPWRFDDRRGFSFNDGPWLDGRIVGGRFDKCMASGPGNRLGNFGPLRGNPDDADLTIALFGSSYTLIDHALDGNTTTNLLQAALSKRLGRKVHVLNYSRDATGLLSMFDIAADVLQERKPDLMIFAFNMTALGYRRHWRVVKAEGPDFYRMHFTRDRSESVHPDRSIVHVNPITKRVTSQWCEAMMGARRSGDENLLRNDPLLQAILDEYRAIMRQRAVPQITVDFWTLRRSFVYDQIKTGNPYGGRKVLRDNASFWEPLPSRAYLEDAQFAAAVRHVRGSGIPFELLHLPALPELRREVEYLSGASGLTDDEQRATLAHVEELAGRRIVRLLDYYSSADLTNPLDLVWSKDDSHPSAKGVVAMAEAIEQMLIQRGHVRQGTASPMPGPHPIGEKNGSSAFPGKRQ